MFWHKMVDACFDQAQRFSASPTPLLMVQPYSVSFSMSESVLIHCDPGITPGISGMKKPERRRSAGFFRSAFMPLLCGDFCYT
jgi:hypothetical protein